MLCRLTNPASGGPPVLFDCSDEQGEPVPKRTNAQGIVEFSAEVPRAVGVSHPGNPIYAEFFVKAMTQGTVFPHYKAPAVARQDLDIYSDTRVSVPDAFAYPGELVPISATLSDAATGTAVPGRELLFHLVVGGQTSDIQATTSVNGVATIMYQTPVGSPLPLIGNFPVLVTFAGDPGPNPAYPASEGIGRLRIGYKGLRLEEYAISAASSLILPNPLDARSTWTLEGTLGQSAIGLPDDPASATVRAQLGFWRTARNLIKKIHWP